MNQNFSDAVYIDVVTALSRLSKCQYLNVACIAVNAFGRIIATGVNGTPSGTLNCSDTCFTDHTAHGYWANDSEIHAEMNMILDLAREGHAPGKNLSIYCNISPCQNCVKHLLGLQSEKSNIVRIVYAKQYHRVTEKEMKEIKSKCSAVGTDFYQFVQK